MKNPKKKIQSTAVTIALLIAGDMSIRAQSESSREAAGDVAKPQTSSPTDFVDTLKFYFRETNHAACDTRERNRCPREIYANPDRAKFEQSPTFPACRSRNRPVLRYHGNPDPARCR